MSKSGSDSDGWTELKHVDDDTGSESSSEFVHLEHNAASYHLKDKSKSDLEDSDCHLEEKECEICSDQEILEASRQVDPREGVDESLSWEPEAEEESRPDTPESNHSNDSAESLHPWENGWFWDTHDTSPTDDEDEAIGGLPPGHHSQSSSPRIPSVMKPLGVLGKSCSKESDTDSDFVCLDANAHEEEPSKAVDLQLSTSSQSSGGSVGYNFRFVNPMIRPAYPHFQFPIPRNHVLRFEDDNESLPDDVDDRCESDISGIAGDESDLSSMPCDLDDLPLTAGKRSYLHAPNARLNFLLTLFAFFALFLAVGIGIGHYLGTTRYVGARAEHIERMKELQDDYIMCLRKQDKLVERLRMAESSKPEAKWEMVISLWKDKYQELLLENADLEYKVQTMQNQSASKDTAKPVKDDMVVNNVRQIEAKKVDEIDDEPEIDQLEEKLDHLEEENHRLGGGNPEIQDKLLRHDVLKLKGRLRMESRDKLAAINQVQELKTQLLSSQDINHEMENKIQKLEEEILKVSREKNDMMERLEIVETNEDQQTVNVEGVDLPSQPKSDDIRNEVNMLNVENDDLKSALVRQRYSAHPGNVVRTSEGLAGSMNSNQNADNRETYGVELKEKTNQLLQENSDLKFLVGKMRYSQKSAGESQRTAATENEKLSTQNELAQADQTQAELTQADQTQVQHTQTEQPQDQQTQAELTQTDETQDQQTQAEHVQEPSEDRINILETKLNEIKESLRREKGRSELWQSLYVAEKTNHDQLNSANSQNVNGFLTCMSFLLPTFHQDSKNRLLNVSTSFDEYLQFIRNISSDSPFLKTIKQKWDQFELFVSNFDGAPEASRIYDDIQTTMIEKWASFKNHTGKRFDVVDTTLKDIFKKIQNATGIDAERSRATVLSLGETLQKTLEKISVMSNEFLQKHEESISQAKTSISDKMTKFGSKIHDGMKKVQRKFEKHGMFRTTPEDGANVKDTRGQCNVKDNRGQCNEELRAMNKPYNEYFRDQPGGKIENKPLHQHKQSSYDMQQQYEEFWGKTGFDPDDFFHEDFFEDNNREWQKHQKKIRKIRGRIYRLNEEMLATMDDDDIEDLYEDIDEVIEESENKVQLPEILKTWLTCQMRWWKSRFQRKNRDEDLVALCGQQLMRWQLRATCEPQPCQKKKKCPGFHQPVSPACQRYLRKPTQEFCQGAINNKDCSKLDTVYNAHDFNTHAIRDNAIKHDQGKEGPIAIEDYLALAIDSMNATENNDWRWYMRRMKASGQLREEINWYIRMMESKENFRVDDASWYFNRYRKPDTVARATIDDNELRAMHNDMDKLIHAALHDWIDSDFIARPLNQARKWMHENGMKRGSKRRGRYHF